MGLRINTNIAAINAQKNLGNVSKLLRGNFARLSSGLRIADAGDDAAGLAISSRLGSKIVSLGQNVKNANDGLSLLKTADGTLSNISDIITRMKELALQAANGPTSNQDKDVLDTERAQLSAELARIAAAAEFNGIQLADGTTSTVRLQVTDGTDANSSFNVTLANATLAGLSLTSFSINSAATIGAILTAASSATTALNSLASSRGTLGAGIRRLNITLENLGNTIENLSAAQSQIKDVDVASETSALTRNSIIQQAAIAILAQANVQPQAALSLLQ